MKITPFNIFQNTQVKSRQTFGAAALDVPKTRCLELFNDIYQNSNGKKIVKKVKIKDTFGKENDAAIIKTNYPKGILLDDCSLYEMYINGAKTGHISFSNNADELGRIYVYGLAADYENSKNYKRIGTELLKLAVEHSQNKGFGGQIYLFADFVPEPTQFYYKNNLRASPQCNCLDHAELEGILNYSIRHNIKSENFEKFPNAIPMSLDKKGAKAFLQGKRLYETMNSKTLYSTKIEGENKDIDADIDFCDFTDRKKSCYLIQIIGKKETKDGTIYEQIASARLKPAKACFSPKYIVDKINIKNEKDEKLKQNIISEISFAIQKIQNT